jgi:squalene cyclase
MNTRFTSAVHDAVAAGLEYILGQQNADGSWTEWELPPGQSSCWTTAFCGYRLRILPPDLAPRAIDAKKRAAEWLLQTEFGGGGWGYNERVGADADSTAYAMLFLSSLGISIPESAYVRLYRFRQPDGGFSTYQAQYEHDSWGVSHPDVTAIVIHALLAGEFDSRSMLEEGLAYVARQQTAAGLWPSFWWETPLYATAATLALLRWARVRIETEVAIDLSKTQHSLLRFQPGNAFEAALLLSSRVHSGLPQHSEANRQIVDHLIDSQQRDGSWPSEPMLRITRRDCFDPWNHSDAGVRFADPTRLFTTVVVLEALSETARV